MKRISCMSPFLFGSFLSLLLLFTFSMFAQDSDPEPQPRNYKWFNLGIGGGEIHEFGRLAFSANGTLRKGNTTYSVRLIALSRPLSEAMYDHAWDLGVLVGRVLTPPDCLVLVSGGTGLAVGGVNAEYDKVALIGIPVEVQLLIKPFSSFGIGFYGFANFNTEETFYGATLCLTWGRS